MPWRSVDTATVLCQKDKIMDVPRVMSIREEFVEGGRFEWVLRDIGLAYNNAVITKFPRDMPLQRKNASHFSFLCV